MLGLHSRASVLLTGPSRRSCANSLTTYRADHCENNSANSLALNIPRRKFAPVRYTRLLKNV